ARGGALRLLREGAQLPAARPAVPAEEVGEARDRPDGRVLGRGGSAGDVERVAVGRGEEEVGPARPRRDRAATPGGDVGPELVAQLLGGRVGELGAGALGGRGGVVQTPVPEETAGVGQAAPRV